jgi:hypothetical protein
MAAALRFNMMHFEPYMALPKNHREYKSTRVSIPNTVAGCARSTPSNGRPALLRRAPPEPTQDGI